jgi:hypothetical protein
VADVVRRIGLSLGADLCWPLCFEEIVSRLGPVRVGRDTVRFEVERVPIEPFDLRARVPYDVLFDRITHWFAPTRERVKTAVLDGVYVPNDPWAIQSMEKHTTYAAMMRLGFPVPDTWLVPQKSYEPKDDLQVTLERYARLFDLGEVGRRVGYPLFMKPYDGGAWVGVTKIDDERALRAAYEDSGRRLMHVQRAVVPNDLFVRGLGIGPQVGFFRYDPRAPLHLRYTTDAGFLTKEEERVVADMTLTINAFFGWDYNSCEALRQDGVFKPIDFANACPDSQVTSLHRHFPWLVTGLVRWLLFCAATKRKPRRARDWEPFFEVAARPVPFAEKLREYGRLARERMDAARFEEFRATSLSSLDAVAHDFFGTERAKHAVRIKVEALFPRHEWDEFTEHFWREVQAWRAGASPAARTAGNA